MSRYTLVDPLPPPLTFYGNLVTPAPLSVIILIALRSIQSLNYYQYRRTETNLNWD